MTNEIRINDKTRTIEITKKFAAAAKRFGTAEYADLQEARRDYPRYRVEIKTASKKADCFKGLTFNYMKDYISKKIIARENEIQKENKEGTNQEMNDQEEKNQYKAILVNFYTLCGKTEDGKDQDFAAAATYGEIRKWFLEQFPELTIQRKSIDEILGKKKTA